MNFLCKVQMYLNSVVSTVNSLSGMVMSDKLKGNTETQYKIIVTLIEFEKEISGFITDIKLDEELPQIVLISKRKFININSRLIRACSHNYLTKNRNNI